MLHFGGAPMRPFATVTYRYDIKRPIDESYQKRLARQVVFAPELGQWNYLVKPANCCNLFFTHY